MADIKPNYPPRLGGCRGVFLFKVNYCPNHSPHHAPNVSLLRSISASKSRRSTHTFLSPNRTKGSFPPHIRFLRHQSDSPEYWQACLMVISLGPCGLPIHCAFEEPRPSRVSEALCLDFAREIILGCCSPVPLEWLSVQPKPSLFDLSRLFFICSLCLAYIYTPLYDPHHSPAPPGHRAHQLTS